MAACCIKQWHNITDGVLEPRNTSLFCKVNFSLFIFKNVQRSHCKWNNAMNYWKYTFFYWCQIGVSLHVVLTNFQRKILNASHLFFLTFFSLRELCLWTQSSWDMVWNSLIMLTSSFDMLYIEYVKECRM